MPDDLEAAVAELCQRHPRFPPGAVARLVCRIAEELNRDPSPDRVSAVRQAAERQLDYTEQILA